MFQNQIGRFQTFKKKTPTNTWMLDYFKFNKHYGCQIYQIPATRGVGWIGGKWEWGAKSLIICEKH